MGDDARDRLRHAVHTNNTHEIKNLGWDGVFGALERMWAKKMDGLDRLAYASAVGDREPAEVLAAVLTAARDGAMWRPKPSELAARTRRGGMRTNAVAATLRLDRQPDTLRLVGDILAEGGYVCECKGRCSAYTQTVKGVLMCTECGGLEPGQAEDAVLPSRETTA